MNIFEGIRTAALAFGIALLIPLTSYYGIQVINPAPKHPTASAEAPEYPGYDASKEELNEYDIKNRPFKEEYNKRVKEYRNLLKSYRNSYFYMSFCIGILIIIIGAIIVPTDALGTGFIIGGIITLIQGYAFVWGEITDLIKFISLISALLLFFLLGIIIWRKK